jgi:glycerol-3-phosphate dehydrogenase
MEALTRRYPFLDAAWAGRLVRGYGTDAATMLGEAGALEDLGEDLGATLTGCEVDWLMRNEFARTAEDVVWRRSKLGLRLTTDQVSVTDKWIARRQSDEAAGNEKKRSGGTRWP